MNPRVIKRFIIICLVATFVFFTVNALFQGFFRGTPGDFYTRQGDIFIGDKKYDEALDSFDKALEEAPNHRGALMGRSLVFMQREQYTEALAELTHLIKFLEKTLDLKDLTGRGTLAAAYANRGIIKDRQEKYKAAFDDYVLALKTDEEAIDGPSLFDKILYGNSKPSTARSRAIYIHKQLQLPPEKRVLRIPEIDDKQRMYKP
ncbi:MAG TPA: tetratricopeptide repeat protein [Rhodospirillales bacterium]|nr:tetratricopeptide repeat protein [Rhodospirillales bacterium]